MTEKLDYQQLWLLTGGIAVGECADVPCPLCRANKSRAGGRRNVLRVWCKDVGMLTYTCARCTASGWVKRDGPGDGREPVHREPKPAVDRRMQARELWQRSVPLEGSLAETYLRTRKCFFQSENVRFLPPLGRFRPSMLARFSSKDGMTNGIHMTRLEYDGTGKAPVTLPKIMLGPSLGYPIIITKGRGPEGLIITEGIEDALSFAIATRYTVWAAGAAGRVPPLMRRSRLFNKVFVSVDDDDAGIMAFRKAQKKNSKIIPINLTRMLNAKSRMDANAMLMINGAVMLGEYVKMAEMQAMMRDAHGLHKVAEENGDRA